MGLGDGTPEQFRPVNAKSRGQFDNFKVSHPAHLALDSGNNVPAYIPSQKIELGH